MALRLILVGLVASMGFEPPSMTRVESWGRTGQQWVVAQSSALMSMVSGPVAIETAASEEPDAAPAEAPALAAAEPAAPAAPEAVDDLTFEVVVEGMAVQFGDDLAMMTPAPAPAVVAATTPAPAPAEPVVVETVPPVVAEVVPPAVEPPSVAATVPHADDLPAPVAEAASTLADATPAAPRAARFSQALRLTSRAMAAWASVLDAPSAYSEADSGVITR